MKSLISAIGLLALAGGVAQADVVQVRVTVQNLAAPNGVALSPLTVAFHNGTWDAFNAGGAASTGVQNIAETGNGAAYLAAFNGSIAQGVSGVVPATVNAFGPGIYLPGGSGSLVFTLDTSANRYFSYGAMVVPSNDMFIGNDNPFGVALFDAAGNFLNPTITLTGGNVWDAGTEVNAPFGSAFLAGQNAADHVAENGLITASGGFAAYAGLLTAAGYSFTDLPGADTQVARITFEIVPSPGAAAALGLGALSLTRRRRTR